MILTTNLPKQKLSFMKAMPQEQANEVLDFVEFIRHKAAPKVGSEQLSTIQSHNQCGDELLQLELLSNRH